MEVKRISFRCQSFKVTSEGDGWVTVEADSAGVTSDESKHDLLTLKQISLLTQSPLRTVRNWTYKPKNPLPTQKVGGGVRVLRSDYEKWVKEGLCPSSRRAVIE